MPVLHIIGIGGVGMNGLAQLAALQGYQVTGSDRAFNPDTQPFKALISMGIHLSPQDGSGLSAATDVVVYSTAIEADNPDLQRAQTLQIPSMHRSRMLKELIGERPLIAVAGTAGKTTTTGLLGWIFDQLGQDPSVYNGAAVLNWKTDSALGNVRAGAEGPWIIEADESDRSFLNFQPTHSIITNITKDHYELDELHALFHQFKQQTSGTVIDCPRLDPTAIETPHQFSYKGLRFHVPMQGRHNLENAYAAVCLCDQLGLDLEQVNQAIRSFKGIERRLECAGTAGQITIYDDYAHNPAKIDAALSAVSSTAHHLHAYWRPHGFTPLYQHQQELAAVFKKHLRTGNCSLYLLPVFYAGGTVSRKIDTERFTAQLHSAGLPVQAVADYAALHQQLKETAQPGDTILGMGARDPELPLFAKRLVATWKTS